MSPNYNLVKVYYERGLWSANRVKNAVGKWITQEEALQILNGKE